MVTNQFPIEKRNFYRHPLSVPIKFEERKTKGAQRSSSVDLSEGGICFLATKFIAKGAPVTLTIPVNGHLFDVHGYVAYSNKTSAQSFYRIGVKFENPSEAFRAKLAEQMILIRRYQDEISEERGQEISEEDAAREWIYKYAAQFSELF